MKESNKAYVFLEYILTKAIVEQKTMEGKISLDYMNLCTENEDVITLPEPSNVKLKVYIRTSWDTSKELQEPDLGVEDESDDEERPSSNGQESH